MAASRATVVQSLSIALIVFVMLTFVLAITTYLFFRQKFDAEAATQAAATEMAKAKADLQTAEGEKGRLKQILGFAEDKPVADIETEVNDLFEKNHEDFSAESKSYRSFSEWLLSSNEAKDKDLKALNAKNAQIEREKATALEAAEKRRQDLEAQARSKEEEAAALKKDFDGRWQEHEKRSKSLTEEQQAALARVGRLDLLEQEIAKGESLLSAQRQARFKGQPAEARVGLFFEELKDRDKVIVRQNELLADLRVADKSLQDTVLAATPHDDRIDGFDGRILSVNELDRTVLLDCGSTRGLRPGLVLRVYGPGEARPQAGDYKAVVQVVAVESDALARARIRSDSVGDPILPGDRVATSLWSPDGTFEAVVVGYVQLDVDAKPDMDRLQELVERIGGRIEPAVSSTTTMVIDAGLPRSPGGVLERAAGWRAADESRREKSIKEARRQGIRIVSVDAFLDMLGLDRGDLDTNRLPRPGHPKAPAAAGNVAY
ncbi:MAG: hypothetical protein EBZ74_01395 [Planctomycetia bacterium]|nr:hypothetical protein [Planctomycetia bacterium]